MFQVMYGAPPTLLSFTLAGILSKRLEDYAFAAARAPFFLLPLTVYVLVGGRPRLSASFAAGTTTVSNRYRSPGFGPWPKSHSSAGAFASGSPARVNEFHLWPRNTPAVAVLSALRGSGTLLHSAPLGSVCSAAPSASLAPLIAVSICCARCPGITAPAGTGV